MATYSNFAQRQLDSASGKELDARQIKTQQDTTRCSEYPGYAVTRDGRVFSIESNWRGYGVREMRQAPNDHGYPSVRLTVGKLRRKHVLVHKLVAAAFLPPRPPGQKIRHLNGIKTDNLDTNLAWGTRADNAAARDAWDTPKKHEKAEEEANAE